jgi:peptidoglycan/LPS O-acetylase OafA/YrhL
MRSDVRIPALDGFRGLAILLVLFYHYTWSKLEHGWVYVIACKVFPLSWSGVDLFFVLSGFLIGGILLDQRDTKNYFRTFYLRRICRIFPLYFLWLVLFFILAWLFLACRTRVWYGWLFAQNFSKVPGWSFAFFVQNIYYAKTYLDGAGWMTATWSLAVEEQFYLLLPLMIWLLPVRSLPYVLASVVLVVPVFRLFLYLYHPEIYTLVLLPCRIDTLLTGVLCAYGVRQEQFRSWLSKNQSRLYQWLYILLAGAGYLTVYANNPYAFEMTFWGYSWMALLYSCLLLIIVSAKQGIIFKLMHISLLRNLGIISYSVYLMHVPINILMHGLILGKEVYIANFSDIVVTFVALGVTLLLAVFSWRFFEKPIIRWGHSFSYSGENRITPP